MLCKNVLKSLSEYFDEALESDVMIQISQHMDQCACCRKEFDSLSKLHGKLKSLKTIHTPEYLSHLVQLRIKSEHQNQWRTQIFDALSYRWSKIRTLEGMWYITRFIGTAMATVFFFLISSTITPIYIEVNASAANEYPFPPIDCQQVVNGVLQRLGLVSVQAVQTSINASKPAINDIYFNKFGKSVSRVGEDDTFSVAYVVDRSGTAKMKNVLEYPTDKDLLNSFNDMIVSARCRPASKYGRAVKSHIVFTYSQISVYN